MSISDLKENEIGFIIRILPNGERTTFTYTNHTEFEKSQKGIVYVGDDTTILGGRWISECRKYGKIECSYINCNELHIS